MEVGDLTTFAAVARCAGITKAAKELHTVQSNVTSRIKALEDEVGVPLFERHSRGVALTSAGMRRRDDRQFRREMAPDDGRIGIHVHELLRMGALPGKGEPQGRHVAHAVERNTTGGIR